MRFHSASNVTREIAKQEVFGITKAQREKKERERDSRIEREFCPASTVHFRLLST